jgi:hypothetical protein
MASNKLKVEKITSYRVTSPDGKIVANGKTEKEALKNLEKAMKNADANKPRNKGGK